MVVRICSDPCIDHAANNGFLTNLNNCVKNNAKNYSIGGVANLTFNTQILAAD